jgi:hypothetical protein
MPKDEGYFYIADIMTDTAAFARDAILKLPDSVTRPAGIIILCVHPKADDLPAGSAGGVAIWDNGMGYAKLMQHGLSVLDKAILKADELN